MLHAIHDLSLQDILMEREDSVEETIMGMATQLAEAEDTFIVEDLQSKATYNLDSIAPL